MGKKDSVSSVGKYLEWGWWCKSIGGRIKVFLTWPFYQYLCWRGWLCAHRRDAQYQLVSAQDVPALKKASTLFIFGSGYSLNDISRSEWEYFERHQTMGFNWFIRQTFVRCDFFLLREIVPYYYAFFPGGDAFERMRQFASLATAEKFRRTLYLVQGGWKAFVMNRLLGDIGMPAGSSFCRYETIGRGEWRAPTERLSEGLVHGIGTLFECLNFGYQMKYDKVVLVGVDLYDQRYFWLPPNETRPELLARGITHDSIHPGNRLIMDYAAYWKPHFAARSIALEVYNPKSLLAEVLPVFDRSVMTVTP